MRIFLTGATGFIGSYLTPELIGAGHQVLGMTRSQAGADALLKAGAQPHQGELADLESLRAGAAQADAVIHLAFDHDFTNFVANCEKDRRAIEAMAEVLRGSGRPLVVTSGAGIGSRGPGQKATEDFINGDDPSPRAATEVACQALAADGVRLIVVRLPQVHDTHKQGLLTPYVEIARQKGVVAFVGDGANLWAAGHVKDVVHLYRLAVEQGEAGERFHAVDEEGVAARDIAEVIAKKLGVPTRSLTPDQAGEHFGWMSRFFSLDMPASSAWTRERLGWRPSGPSLLSDLEGMAY